MPRETQNSVTIQGWDDQTGCWFDLDEATNFDSAEGRINRLQAMAPDRRFRIVETRINEFPPIETALV